MFPSKYDPSFCKKLIEHMSKGFSYTSFAGIIDVNVTTLDRWCNDFPEFAEAKTIGESKNLLYWEQKGIEGTEGKQVSAPMWMFNMKNRHRWCDRVEQEVKNDPLSGFSDAKALKDEVIQQLHKAQKEWEEIQRKRNSDKEE